MIYVHGYKREYKGETVKVCIGKSKGGKDIHFTIRKYGVTPIIARSRTGKTNIVKIILSVMGNIGRRLIIFDPYKDYEKIRIMNPDSDYPVSVPNVKIIGQFTFPISSFHEIDYVTMGFPDFAARVVAILGRNYVKGKHGHNNEPEKFYQMLRDIPVDPEGERAFEQEYGFWTDKIYSTTKKTMLKRFEMMRESIVYDPDGDIPYQDAGTIQEDAREYNLIFDMSSFAGETGKMQVYVGMILRMLKPILTYIKPLVVLEEFDKLCPPPFEQFVPSSYVEIRDYAIKLQRHGIHILAISQNDGLINPDVMENWHQKIQGKVAYKNEISERLRFYEDFGVREFAVIDANNNVFILNPPIAPCGY